MVKIEYSPNSRAHCQKCFGRIESGSIRICAKGAPVTKSSGFINKYTHAECYTNRKDFTQLYGFRDLSATDQKRFMTEKQKRIEFPGDYILEDVEAAAAAPMATGLQKRDFNAAAAEQGNGPAKKKSKGAEVAAAPPSKKKPVPLTIVGLKYAEARAGCGEKVTLVREPENKYDPNAIKVINSSNRKLGHIKKEDAASISKTLDKINADLRPKGQHLVAEGTILNAGDGYKQSVEVTFKKLAAKTKGGTTPKSDKVQPAPVTVSSKMVKG